MPGEQAGIVVGRAGVALIIVVALEFDADVPLGIFAPQDVRPVAGKGLIGGGEHDEGIGAVHAGTEVILVAEMLEEGAKVKIGDVEAQLVGVLAPAVGAQVVGGEPGEPRPEGEYGVEVHGDLLFLLIAVVVHHLVGDADIVEGAEMVADAGAEDAVAAAPLLGIEGRGWPP